MIIDRPTFEACVTEANLAPSVHNVQPARWRLEGDVITMISDPKAAVAVADPSGVDLLLSCGAALEGMVIALSQRGIAATVSYGEPLATLTLGGFVAPDPLAAQVARRMTCRTGFAPLDTMQTMGLLGLVAGRDDLHLLSGPDAIAAWSKRNDSLSLDVFRDPAFRREILRWMRLKPAHPRWAHDGLNAAAMGIAPAERLAVPLAMSRPVFALLDRLGLSGGLVAEDAKTRQSAAILCMSVPQDETEIDAGRRYYRMVLELAALGLATWPMSVLVDKPEARKALEAELGVPAGRRIRSCLRIGVAANPLPLRARRPVTELIY